MSSLQYHDYKAVLHFLLEKLAKQADFAEILPHIEAGHLAIAAGRVEEILDEQEAKKSFSEFQAQTYGGDDSPFIIPGQLLNEVAPDNDEEAWILIPETSQADEDDSGDDADFLAILY